MAKSIQKDFEQQVANCFLFFNVQKFSEMDKKKKFACVKDSSTGKTKLLDYILASEESMNDYLFLTLLQRGGAL